MGHLRVRLDHCHHMPWPGHLPSIIYSEPERLQDAGKPLNCLRRGGTLTLPQSEPGASWGGTSSGHPSNKSTRTQSHSFHLEQALH